MKRSKLQPVSRAESEMLTIVWDLGEATIQNILDRLPADRPLAYSTVQTLLRRLEAKGYIRHKLVGKAYVFLAAAKREEVIGTSIGDFINRLFGGDPAGLMIYLAQHGKMSKQDIAALKQILDEQEKKE